MSPLRSSPMYMPSYPDSTHSSRMTPSQYYEHDPDISADDGKEPRTKKLKLYHKKTYPVVSSSQVYMSSHSNVPHSSTTSTSYHIEVLSTSLNEEYEPDQTTSTTKTKKQREPTAKRQTKLNKQSALSQEQINALKSVTINLQEFINIYDNVPVKFRKREFYVTCRTYIHELSKTKTTMAEKQALFMSLPQTLKTSFQLFELIFKQESIVLSDIMSGKTDIKNLQNSIKTLLSFFSPSYLQKQIYQFTKHKPDLSKEDKNIVSTCKKHLKYLEKQRKNLLPSDEKILTESSTTSHTSVEKETISKHKLHPEAKKILDSFKNNTIDINDIITSRQKLILLEVDRRLIHNTLRSFKNTISMSHRPDKKDILQILQESGKQASKIRSAYIPISNDLKNLYNQALEGTLPIHLIKDLRKLLFNEYNISKASSSLQSAKKALIKYNKEQEAEIKKAFEKEYRRRVDHSHHYKLLKEKIKSGNLKPSQFTYIYDSIPQQKRLGTLSKICNEYIKKQAEHTKSFEDRLNILRDLPQPLQKSPSIISILFPYESSIMSSIRNGTIASSDIHKHLSELLKITDIYHIKNIIGKHVTAKKVLTQDEKTHIAQCRSSLKHLLQIQSSQSNTHKPDSRKSHEQQPSDATILIVKQKDTREPSDRDIEYGSNSSDDEQNPQKHKQKLHPEAKKILEALDSGTLDTNDIITSRKNLVLLGVEKNIINKSFKKFRRHIQRSHRQDTKEILQIITEAGNKASKIKSAYMPTSNELQLLLDKAYAGILPLEDVQNLRDLLLKEYTIEKATSCFQNAKKALIKHNECKEQLIQEAFKKTRRRPTSSHYQDLQAKIKSGNLNIDTFTHMYNSIPQSDRTGSFSILCTKYIKHLSDTIPNIFDDKTKLLKSLPLSLQKSPSILNTIFPKESRLISQIKTGTVPSCDIKTNFIPLLKIISPKHASRLLNHYLVNNKCLSTDDKKNIDDCKAILKQHKYSPIQPTIYKKASNKTNKLPSSEPFDSPTKEYSIHSKKNKPDIYPQSKSLFQQHTKTPLIRSGHINEVLEEHTYTTSPQPSTSYQLEIDYETVQPISSDELTYILQSIVNDDDESSTRTSPVTTTSNEIDPSVEYKANNEKQVSFTTSYDTNPIYPEPETYTSVKSTIGSSSWYTDTQPAYYETPIDILKEHIDKKSPQPSTSSQLEIYYETVQPLSIKQISSNELTCILQSIVDDEESTITSQLTTTYNETDPSVGYEANIDYETVQPLSIEQISSDELTCILQNIVDNDEAYTSTSQLTTTSSKTDPLVEYETVQQLPLEQISSNELTRILQSIVDDGEAYTSTSQNTRSQFTTNTSVEYEENIDHETVQQFTLEQISSDELTCILQSIVNEDESSKDQIVLQNYILQLANKLQQ